MAYGDAWSRFTTAIRCWKCGTAVPFDVRRVELRDGEPTIPCTRCGATVTVPSFDVGTPDDEEPENVGVVDDLAPEPLGGDDDQAVGAPDLEEPVRVPWRPALVARAERRSAARAAEGPLTCRACGERVPVEPDTVRLRWTHALLACPSCATEVRIRRSDAYRDVDPALPWAFAAYSTTASAPVVVEEPRSRLPWRRG
jgi:uncharacterized C2H2 Zn-finger protein